MNALLIDSDPASRATLRRLLVRDFDCTVAEADNGIDGLEAIERNRADFVIMDLRLPLLDGLRVLEITRQSADGASLAVIVTALGPDREQIRRAVDLGVADCILKPFEAGTLSQRLGRAVHASLVGRLNRTPDSSVKDAVGLLSTTGPSATPTALVVDQQRDFRHFVASTLSNRAIVKQASSGLEALKLALATPPTLVFVGQELGILKSETLVQELRRHPQLARTRIVGLAPKHLTETVRASAPYDAVLIRTFLPDLFIDQLAGILASAGALSALRQADPALAESIVSAVQLVGGSMFSVQFAPVSEAAPSTDEEEVWSTVDIDVPGHRAGIALDLSCSLRLARELAARMAENSASEMSPQDATDALSEVANMVSGRLKGQLAGRGMAITCSLPKSRLRGDERAPGARDALVCHFVEPEQGMWLRATLRCGGVPPK